MKQDLASRYLSYAYGFVRRLPNIRLAQDRDDLVSDLSLTLVRCLKQYDETKPASFGTYVHEAYRNTYVTWLQKRATASALTNCDGFEFVRDYRYERPNLDEHIDRLPPRHAEVLRRRYFDGQTLKEVGRDIGVSYQEVARIQARAERRLAEILCP